MANIKELRVRIKSVTGINKITAAMEMVASMKLRKVQAKALSMRPYALELLNLIEHLAEFIGHDTEIPLFTHREIKTTGVFLISSDRGLCGAYNANVMACFHKLEKELLAKDPERKMKLYVYGKKGYSYLYRRGYEIERFFVDPPLDKAGFEAAKMVSNALVAAFRDGTIDEVQGIYTHFASVARFQPKVGPYLPASPRMREAARLEAEAGTAKPAASARPDYILEPNPEAILNLVIPRYLDTIIFDVMLESLASEHASRRMAMKGATDAAARMTKDLKKVYNRVRQETITKELLDIVGGANAVS